MDESGFSQRAPVRKTWAPKGHTPVVVLPYHWKRLSAMGALATRAAGHQARLFLSLKEGAVNGPKVVEFVQSLHRHIRGRILLVIDRLRAHTHGLFPPFVAAHHDWLRVVYLPAYAPELQPVEWVWAYLDRTDLANYCADDLAHVPPRLRRGVRRLRRTHASGAAFLRASTLF